MDSNNTPAAAPYIITAVGTFHYGCYCDALRDVRSGLAPETSLYSLTIISTTDTFAGSRHHGCAYCESCR